ncbi:MAG: ABC transporter permease [Peptococcaceae bacterium]|nr:ABC transporter permease [Peptococcaceae bacterium]
MALIRSLRAELLKGRRAPVWLAFVVLPLIPAFLGTANYLANQAVLDDDWYSLWTQHTLFAAFFFLPALISVYCAWEWWLEASDHNFNSFMTAPVPCWALYLGKLIPAICVSVLTQGLIGVYFIIGGKLAGISDALPPALFEWLACGALGSTAICAVQLFLSLLMRSFVIPVVLGLFGGIAGLLLTTQGLGIYWPYTLMALGMRANNPKLVVDTGQLALMTAVYTVIFAALTLRLLTHRDVQSE